MDRRAGCTRRRAQHLGQPRIHRRRPLIETGSDDATRPRRAAICSRRVEKRFTGPRALRRSCGAHPGSCAGARDNVARSRLRASILPTVATSAGTRAASRSTAPIHSAAPASASRRKCIGVVPAWLALPLNVHVEPALSGDGVTTPSGRFRACRAPVPARCETPDSRALGLRHAASPTAAGFRPNARIASATDTPSASRIASSASSRVPTSARLPMNGTPKRTPSSSENPTTSMRESQPPAAERLRPARRPAPRPAFRRRLRRAAPYRGASR